MAILVTSLNEYLIKPYPLSQDILNEAKEPKKWGDTKMSVNPVRYTKELLNQIDELGIEIDPKFKADLIANDYDWNATWNNKDRKARSKSNFTKGVPTKVLELTDREALEMFWVRGNTGMKPDWKNIPRLDVVRGSQTISNDAKEVAFLVFCEILRTKNLPANELVLYVQSIGDYGIKEVLKNIKSSVNLDALASEIAYNPNETKSIAESAINFLSYFSINGKHPFFKDPSYDAIRKLGTKQTGLNPDKWNPFDVYYCSHSNGLASLAGSKDITFDFNKMVDSNELLPLSLKQSDAASHGSLTIQSVLDNYKPYNPFDRMDRAQFAKFLVQEIRQLQSKCTVFVTSDTKDKSVTDYIMNKPDLEKRYNWFSVYPCVLERFNQLNNLIPALEDALLVAHSLSTKSSKFYLTTPKTFKKYGETSAKIHFKHIEIPLDQISIKVFYTLEIGDTSREYMSQIRYKQGDKMGVPQFVVQGTVTKTKSLISVS